MLIQPNYQTSPNMTSTSVSILPPDVAVMLCFLKPAAVAGSSARQVVREAPPCAPPIVALTVLPPMLTSTFDPV